MKLHEAFSPEESKKIYDNFLAIVNDPKRRDKLVRKHGKNAENVAYGTAVNQVKKQAANNIEKPQPEETMENSKLREMVIDALTLKKQGKLDEDMDLGHEDDEPNMIKADLYQIGKYAMKLYKMVDQFDNGQEVDFPHWWQSKIITAKNMISSAKHYLEFELKEPELNAMVDVASEEGAIDEKFASKAQQKYLYATNPKVAEKLGSKMAKKDYKNLPEKIKEAILAKLKNK